MPNKPASYSGVGKNSKRTDGQPVRSPNVQEGTDLTVGDRRTIEAGQRLAPLGQQASPRLQAPPRAETPSGAGGGALPQNFFERATSRPGEDLMAPANPAPAEPADDQEVVLQFLVDAFGDQSANRMLQEKRSAKQAPAIPPPAPSLPVPSMAPQDEPEPQASDAFDDLPVSATATEEPVEEVAPSPL